ncbi:MAG TPA: hypothetical protein VFB10_00300 [Candidatus Dormibacteraeota bacterium]|nr:hypothetical protein [Candidatus Dormibacteraeota bacterium]
MRLTTTARTLAFILPLACFFALPLAAQDSQDTSIADAARRSREQKKASAKPAPIITDDTLTPAPTSAPAATPSAASAPGAPAGVASSSGSNTPDENAPSAGAAAEKKKQDAEALKQEVAALQSEVDFAQRSLSLDQDAFYSKPDFSNDKDGKAKLEAEEADLKQKQDDLARLKDKFAALGVVEEPKTPAPPAKP